MEGLEGGCSLFLGAGEAVLSLEEICGNQERADAIKAYLIRKGIKAKRLEAKGYGQTRPIESDDTERGREINRRVEINVVKEETK